MAGADFERLLKTTMGLDAASIGSSAIDRAVHQRQTACHLERTAYWDLVRSSKTELQALIEAVVVPETWFFRDAAAFAALAEIAGRAWRADTVVHLLSVPCSTGEEPYSMAMALLDAGVPPARFTVNAVDISEHALTEARLGEYRKSSFRGQDLEYRGRHFDAIASGYRIHDAVRRQVDFRHGNLLNPGSFPGAGAYDVVFCRNVLIYFDRETQARALTVLSSLLAPQGLLFVWPAEAAVVLDHGFVSAKIPKAHAFRRREDIVASPKAGSPARAGHDSARPERATTRHPARPAHPQARPAATHVHVKRQQGDAEADRQKSADLDAAVQLANDGRFVEAAAQCQAHLHTHGPSAQVFCLLGLVRDADGRSVEAVSSYRKALYLDPHHHDALVHLALLLERQGNKAEADRLRSRAKRTSGEAGVS